MSRFSWVRGSRLTQLSLREYNTTELESPSQIFGEHWWVIKKMAHAREVTWTINSFDYINHQD